jgi:hypothetical protein
MMERGLSYAHEANRCRRQASRFQGKPEKPFLLRLAAEFETLEQGRTAANKTYGSER